jgi:biotin carboxylase
MNVLCIASYEKGHDFLREAKLLGCNVVLVTSLKLKDTARWPPNSVDEFFYMPDRNHEWNRADVMNSVSFLARKRNFDRIVPLDDFDVELAASLREHLRIPGIGETQVRFFRDKLAMRMGAHAAGIHVPEFVAAINYDRIHAFIDSVPGPWVLKPRSLAGAIGIKKIHSAEELWPHLDALGDMQSHYLLERFVPGRVFHVDTIVSEGRFVFAVASGYGRPPMEVSHGGGVFTTCILDRNGDDAGILLAMNQRLLTAFGLSDGVSHTEFIRAQHDGQLYFLETSARVGGAHIADLVQAATGVNLWAEWAKIESATPDRPYEPPQARSDYAGLMVSLARQEHPDTSAYNDHEIVWRMEDRAHHVGLIVRSPSSNRVSELVESYSYRIQQDFGASLPPLDKPDA